MGVHRIIDRRGLDTALHNQLTTFPAEGRVTPDQKLGGLVRWRSDSVKETFVSEVQRLVSVPGLLASITPKDLNDISAEVKARAKQLRLRPDGQELVDKSIGQIKQEILLREELERMRAELRAQEVFMTFELDESQDDELSIDDDLEGELRTRLESEGQKAVVGYRHPDNEEGDAVLAVLSTRDDAPVEFHVQVGRDQEYHLLDGHHMERAHSSELDKLEQAAIAAADAARPKTQEHTVEDITTHKAYQAQARYMQLSKNSEPYLVMIAQPFAMPSDLRVQEFEIIVEPEIGGDATKAHIQVPPSGELHLGWKAWGPFQDVDALSELIQLVIERAARDSY
jgi:hypothetical protein